MDINKSKVLTAIRSRKDLVNKLKILIDYKGTR